MILINLLPEEYRQQQRTPIKLLATVACMVALNGSLLAWWAWTAFGVAAEVSAELSVLEDTMGSLRPQIDYHKALDQENRQYKSRESTLRSITSNRVSWTQKVDQLVDVVHRGGSGETKYLVWLDDLSVSQKEDSRRSTFGNFKASGHSGSGNFAHVANFLEDIERSPFIHGFTQPAPPEGSQSSVDKDLIPAEVWSFPLELALLSPEERQ